MKSYGQGVDRTRLLRSYPPHILVRKGIRRTLSSTGARQGSCGWSIQGEFGASTLERDLGLACQVYPDMVLFTRPQP
jgi:hypothetical protein